MRTRERIVLAGSLVALVSALHCSVADLPSESGECPCAPGYFCDTSRDLCVRNGETTSSQASTSGSGGSPGNGGNGASSTASNGGAGGSGGTGGSGGDGVGACGGANPWNMDDGVDWATYMCTLTTPNCAVQSDHVLCCDNTHPVDAHQGPSSEDPFSGTLKSSYSWFVCWVTGEKQMNGNTVWLYTSLDDPPGVWGFVAASALMPNTGSLFNPADPAGSGLPNCSCTQ